VDHTYVDAKNLKNLEQYAIALSCGIFSLKTLESFEIRVIDIGILTEDLECRSNTLLWDIRRLIKIYSDQLEGTLELVPDDFNTDTILEILKKQTLTKARSITRKRRVKKDV